MPKLPYKSKKKSDEDIVSFKSFCNDKSQSGSSKQDSLTLNDNINYHIYYEKKNGCEDNSEQESQLKETSLSGSASKFSQGTSKPKKDKRFHLSQSDKYAFINKIKHSVPKSNNDGSTENLSEKGHGYERFSESNWRSSRWMSKVPSIGSGILVVTVLFVLCVAVWWGVWGLVGGAWGEEHYRRLWERAHQQHNQNHHTHYSPSVIVHQQLERLDPIVPFEPKYHDHNNLSTKNRNASEINKPKGKGDGNGMKVHLVFLGNSSELPPEPVPGQCAKVPDDMRFDCFPQSDVSEKTCTMRGCCWIPHNRRKPIHYKVNGHSQRSSIGLPYCFYPPKYGSYQIRNSSSYKQGFMIYLERQFASSYPGDVNIVAIDVKYFSDDVFRIKIYDAENVRYEPSVPQISIVPGSTANMKYRVVVENQKLGFKIVRVSDGTVIMDCQDVGGFIFSNNFLQMSYLLPSSNIYGLGEHQGRFLLPSDWQRYTLFNYDTAPTENKNLYGSHPFYLLMEKSGASHGVFLFNSNAMDVILQPTPAITFRTIGGILDFYVMMGPEPGNVISQYTSLIGRPFLPPYWSLGFHLCKYGYGSLNHTRLVWERTRNAGIPFDVQWNDLDYMNNSNDFTHDHVLYKELPDFVDTVHRAGMHYVLLVDPGVSASEPLGTYPPFDKGLDMDVFIKNSSSQPFVGKVWNKGSTVWPDFTHPNATSYWVEMLTDFHKEIHYDGIWIDMNEPSNFLSGPLNGECEKEKYPYYPGIGGNVGLRSGTLCMDAKHYQEEHFNLHNLYSLTEAIVTNFALKEVLGRRPFIISRSSFPGLGKYSGHWSGDIYSDWHDMKMTVPQMLSFSLFGVPMMGADICGFNGNSTVELCRRWMELGAFYPFSRNHNSDVSIEQDPVALGSIVVEAARKALITRYTVLPYLYTLFWNAHFKGETVARPLFFEFPRDNETYPLDQQFLWGSHLMIIPILDPNMSTTKAYLPKGAWFNFNTCAQIRWAGWGNIKEGESVLIRGGSVLPIQRPEIKANEFINTATVRNKPLELLIALDTRMVANGSLFWDDGISLNTYEEKVYSLIDFAVHDNILINKVHWWGFGVPPIEKITFLGLSHKVSSVTLNDQPVSFKYDTTKQILFLDKISIMLDRKFVLRWK